MHSPKSDVICFKQSSQNKTINTNFSNDHPFLYPPPPPPAI